MRVYTTGVFDILHRGHLNVLTQAAALGDLTVGIMTDEGVECTKGAKPILSLEERDAQVRSLPFVTRVIHYTEIDQRANYASVAPDIIVQGDDWLFSADRSKLLEYLKANDIRLVLLPRTQGISTTEIKKRVERSRRRDESFLRERMRLVPLSQLRRYEMYDEQKTRRLVEKIKAEGIFLNPLAVVREMIVIDGANRLEALTRLGASFVPCIVYDYSEIDLLANVHYLNNGVVSRMSEFAREQGEKIEFELRTPDEIRKAADSGELIPSGETFHRLPQNIIRLPIRLKELQSESPFDLASEVERRIAGGKVRYFQSGVYICDEW